MVTNNGLAERQNKIKLTADTSSSIVNQYEDAPLFSVGAIGDDVNYQWQYKTTQGNWVNIPNGVFSGLKLSEIPPSLNATVFRCRVYNSIGSTYSDEVVLNVKQPSAAPVITQQPQSTLVEPTSSSDVLETVYAAVVVGLNNGGGTSGGGSSDLYSTSNMNETSPNAVPTTSATRVYVAEQIAQAETRRKYIYVNNTVLQPENEVITLTINHNLNEQYVNIATVEKTTGKLNPFVCSIDYVDSNTAKLYINSPGNIPFAAGVLMVIASK
jgi:hypothetical protein